MRGNVRPSKKVLLQVLWTGVDESAPCLFLLTDSKRYLFNCSEGLQRLFTQCKIKIGKLDSFFFTRLTWSHMGGFPGFAMTLRDVKSSSLIENSSLNTNKPSTSGKKNKQDKRVLNVKQEELNTSINVHGPEGIEKVLSATHTFMKFDYSNAKINITEYGKSKKKEEYLEDSEMIVHSFPIYGSSPLTRLGGHFPNNRLIEPLHPSIVNSTPSVCYACHLRPLPGRFLPDKANELGVPKGPLFGILTKREKVTLDNGTVISPNQVMEEDVPGVTILVVDLPGESYIKHLSSHSCIGKYTTVDHTADLVLHLSKENICTHEKYQEWVERFPATTKQIYFHGLKKNIVTFEGQNHLQQMLNYVEKDTFPLIDTDVPKYFSVDKEDTLYNLSSLNLRRLISDSPLCYDHGMSIKQHPTQCFVEKAKELLAAVPSTQNLRTNVQNHTVDILKTTNNCTTEVSNVNGKRLCGDRDLTTNLKRQELDASFINQSISIQVSNVYPKVVFLGTGSAIPSKYRNVTSIMVILREDTAILLDCGEDTYGQLLRHYGKDVDKMLKKIKIVLVSHLHADHHLGVFTIVRKINQLKKDNEPDILVVAPSLFKNWFVEYAETSEMLNCQFIVSQKLYDGSRIYKDIRVQSVKVRHPAMAHGYVVGYGDKGDRLVFSGDSLPCDALIETGKNCTLLIHEATLEDDMVEEALARRHTTTTQALEVAEKMNAKYVILTHFSQRYPKIPVINTQLPIFKRTAIAFDHMEISVEAIPHFHKLIPKLSALFAEPVEEEKGLII